MATALNGDECVLKQKLGCSLRVNGDDKHKRAKYKITKEKEKSMLNKLAA